MSALVVARLRAIWACVCIAHPSPSVPRGHLMEIHEVRPETSASAWCAKPPERAGTGDGAWQCCRGAPRRRADQLPRMAAAVPRQGRREAGDLLRLHVAPRRRGSRGAADQGPCMALGPERERPAGACFGSVRGRRSAASTMDLLIRTNVAKARSFALALPPRGRVPQAGATPSSITSRSSAK